MCCSTSSAKGAKPNGQRFRTSGHIVHGRGDPVFLLAAKFPLLAAGNVSQHGLWVAISVFRRRGQFLGSIGDVRRLGQLQRASDCRLHRPGAKLRCMDGRRQLPSGTRAARDRGPRPILSSCRFKSPSESITNTTPADLLHSACRLANWTFCARSFLEGTRIGASLDQHPSGFPQSLCTRIGTTPLLGGTGCRLAVLDKSHVRRPSPNHFNHHFATVRHRKVLLHSSCTKARPSRNRCPCVRGYSVRRATAGHGRAHPALRLAGSKA